MNKFIIKPFLIVFLFLFIYNPPVKFLPLNTGVIIGAVFFVLYLLRLFLKIDLSKQVSMNKDVLRLIILIAAIVMYSFLIAIVSGSGDFQLFRFYLAFLIFGVFFWFFLGSLSHSVRRSHVNCATFKTR